MALTFDTTGLTIQTQAEIFAELAAAIQDPSVLGPDADVSESSTLGKILAVFAGREASLQQLLEMQVLTLDPQAASGFRLDTLALLNGVARLPATYAASASGIEVVTTGATVVPGGSIVRNDRTGDDWLLAASVVAGGAGTHPGSIIAREPGVKEYLGSDTWTIVTPSANWSAFGTAGDLDPNEAGSDVETDEELRSRRKLALVAQGNDFGAIVAAVAQLAGVDYVGGLNNRTDAVLDGVPAGAFEIVVSGGDNTAIAEAILDHLPPGAEAYGGTTVTLATPGLPGQTIDVGFSRPVDVDIWLRITVSSTGTEIEPAPNAASAIETEILSRANALMADPGTDVVPGALTGYVWAITADATTGRPTLTSALVEASTDGATWSTAPIVIDHDERADYDSARVSVIGP